MKAYPEYKDSGYDWIGDIPEQWKMVQLKFVAPRKTEQTEDVKGFGFQIALENIESKTGKILGSGSFEGLGNIFRKDDVLFNKLRPYLCKVVIAPNDGVAVSELLVLRPREDIENRFLFYRLLESKFISVVDGSTYGAKMPRANWDFIGNLKIPTPSLPEQQAIADFLDRKTAQIDALIEKKQRQIDLLHEQRTALINHAVTKGLNPDVRMKDSGVEWLGEIPSHWIFRRNGTLFDQRDERNSPELPLLHVSIHTGVTLREFSSDRVEQMASDWSTYKKAEKGDIAFNKMRMWQGAVGVAPVTGLVSSDYTVAKPRVNVNPFYFEYQFRTHGYKTEINRNSHGIVPDRNRLYWDDFKQLQSLYPPFEEQNAIVDYLSIELDKIEKVTQKVSKEIELIQEYRTALISEAVTGKIDVRTAETVHE